jgi:hypothetical protein
MKKADNFDPSKWLVENKITNQSRLNENEHKTLSPNMQKQFNMIVSALKKAKTEKEVDNTYYKIVMLPNKVSKIFFDKLVDMGLAEKTEDGKVALYYNDELDESNLNEDALSQEKQMVFKDITKMMNQELTSGESTHDALVKLRDFISNLLESDF